MMHTIEYHIKRLDRIEKKNTILVRAVTYGTHTVTHKLRDITRITDILIIQNMANKVALIIAP